MIATPLNPMLHRLADVMHEARRQREAAAGRAS